MSSLRDALSSALSELHIENVSLEWADPVDWLMKYFYVFDTEALIEIYPCQAEPLRYFLQRDEFGNFGIDLLMWSWPKKSAKSIICAGILDWIAYHMRNAPIRIVSNDLKQATSRNGMYVVRNIQIAKKKGYPLHDDESRLMYEFRQDTIIDQSETRVRYPNGSIIECVPMDAKGEAGGNDVAVSVGELWGYVNEKASAMWTETTPPPTKHGKSIRIVDTYAGFTGQSIVLEPLYEQLVIEGTRIPFPHNDECYQNGRIGGTWVTKHHLPWQTAEYYESQRKVIPDKSEYNRIHSNQWSSGKSPFVSIDDWDANAIQGIVYNREDVFISLDAGRNSDAFAITAGCRLSHTINNLAHITRLAIMHNINPKDFIGYYLLKSRIWYPEDYGGILKYSGYDDSPLSYLQYLIDTYPVYVVTYDPYQLAHFVDEAERFLPCEFEEFAQGQKREKSDKHLRDIIQGHMLLHDGSHEDVRQHLINADTHSARGRVRIEKRTNRAKVDLAVSMSMLMWTIRGYMVDTE